MCDCNNCLDTSLITLPNGTNGTNGTDGINGVSAYQGYYEGTTIIPALGDNKLFNTNISIVSTGVYLVTVDADINDGGSSNNYVASYYFMKNNIYTALGNDRDFYSKGGDLISKIGFSEFISLTTGDLLNVNFEVTTITNPTHVINKRGITLIKVA